MERIQWLQYLSHNHEDLSSDPQKPSKCWVGMESHLPMILALEGKDRKLSRTSWLMRLAISASSGFDWGVFPQWIRRRKITGEWFPILTLGFHVPMHTVHMPYSCSDTLAHHTQTWNHGGKQLYTSVIKIWKKKKEKKRRWVQNCIFHRSEESTKTMTKLT